MWAAAGLSAKTAVHINGDIQRFCCVIKAGELCALLRWQNIQFGQRFCIVRQHGIGKGAQALGHAADGFTGKELCAVFEVNIIAAVGPLTKIEAQVKLAALVRQL